MFHRGSKALLFACAALIAGAAHGQEAKLPAELPDAPDWCKSRWGADDQIGAANLLSPERTLAATKLVKTGKTYSLGTDTHSTTPMHAPRSWAIAVTQPGQAGGASLGPSKTTYNDEIYFGYAATGTQIDGLGHIGIDNVYYNCFKNSDFVRNDGLTRLGVQEIPNIVTRGVVVDMTAYFGKPVLDAGTVFNRKEIEEQLAKQGIEIAEGDVVLFHTGWSSLVGKDDALYLSGEPGLGKDGALYLAEKNVIAVGADTYGVEAIPFPEGTGVFEVHQILIPRNGIYILENIMTSELVADQAWEFMFVLGPTKVTGGVQAIVNPTAIR